MRGARPLELLKGVARGIMDWPDRREGQPLSRYHIGQVERGGKGECER